MRNKPARDAQHAHGKHARSDDTKGPPALLQRGVVTTGVSFAIARRCGKRGKDSGAVAISPIAFSYTRWRFCLSAREDMASWVRQFECVAATADNAGHQKCPKTPHGSCRFFTQSNPQALTMTSRVRASSKPPTTTPASKRRSDQVSTILWFGRKLVPVRRPSLSTCRLPCPLLAATPRLKM